MTQIIDVCNLAEMKKALDGARPRGDEMSQGLGSDT
jgi:hypothetical protein